MIIFAFLINIMHLEYHLCNILLNANCSLLSASYFSLRARANTLSYFRINYPFNFLKVIKDVSLRREALPNLFSIFYKDVPATRSNLIFLNPGDYTSFPERD